MNSQDTFSGYYRRFFGRLLKDGYEWPRDNIFIAFSMVIVPPAAVWLRDPAHVPDWPTIKIAGWLYLALFTVYAIYHIIRTPWKLDKERVNKIIALEDKLSHQATMDEIKERIVCLTQLIDRGRKFTQQCRTSRDLVPEEPVNVWASEVEDALTRIFDSTYISRFESGVGVPMGAAHWPNMENRFTDGFVWVRVYRLQEFIDELRALQRN
jgi:hypothetical protein